MALGKRSSSRKWWGPDLIRSIVLVVFSVFFLLIATRFRDSISFATRRPVAFVDTVNRQRLLSMIDSDKMQELPGIDVCPPSSVDHMPCEDPSRNSHLSREMNFYRERQCPVPEEVQICLVSPPAGYQIAVPWPESLHKIWYDNMPHTKIADRKGHQGWMRKEGPYFIFPGGGTMFPDGAVQYIRKLSQYIPIDGGVLRTALDMGCGVASFGGYMLKENILTISFAPRDSHKAQIQFALERGIPAFVAMLGTRRLPFPAFAFDLVHCSRCLIPFTAYGGTYFVEVDRLLRPGGYLVISGPPVQWHKQEKEWADLQSAAQALCYEMITVDGNTAVWKKPSGDSPAQALCYEMITVDRNAGVSQNASGNFYLANQTEAGFHLCTEDDNPSDAWYFKLKNCVSKLPTLKKRNAVGFISNWPDRLFDPPASATIIQNGTAAFLTDTQIWATRVAYYKKSLGIKLGTPAIRNVMDMNAYFGGFAASLVSDPVWVMNVIPSHKQQTLGVIYDRGLIGVYHDWCEAFSTYPRTYDLIHVADMESLIQYSDSGKNRCHLIDLILEIDRILRPKGTIVLRDSPEMIEKVRLIAPAIRWQATVHSAESESNSSEKILVATKKFWKLQSSSR